MVIVDKHAEKHIQNFKKDNIVRDQEKKPY